jgi:rare lipoprotein A
MEGPGGGSSIGEYKIGKSYQVNGEWYTPREDYSYDETGLASWYGPGFHGKQTANGEAFDSNELTAAHRTLPMPSLVRVTNLENGRSIVVRINDRGPFANGRIIDLSRRGAQLLGFQAAGVAKVRVAVLEPESRALAEGAMRRGKRGQTMVASSQPSPEAYNPPETMADNSDNAVDPNDVPDVSVNNDAPVMDSPETARLESVEATPLDAPGTLIAKVDQPQVLAAAEPKYGHLPPIAPREPMIKSIEGKQKNGRFYPAPKFSQGKAEPNSKIYVQAGAFANQDNAVRLQAKLVKFAPTTISQAVVNGTNFYRVRLGPIKTADEADRILAKVMGQSNAARITVE